MPALIYEDNMYSLKQTPWHKIGEVGTEGETVEAIAARMSIPEARLINLSGRYGGKMVKSDWQHVAMIPASGEPTFIGSPVRTGYQLITHQQAIKYFAEEVRDLDGNMPFVETMGLLGRVGERLFISIHLPDYDVKGDEINSYMILYNPVVPGVAARVFESDIRPVCWNTLQAALQQAKQDFEVWHSDGAEERFRAQLSEMYRLRLQAQSIIKEAYELMASTPVTVPEIRWIAETVYRTPSLPNPARICKADYNTRMDHYERAVAGVQEVREHAIRLFSGEGLGLGTGPLAGTAWHGWNAFTEIESHLKGKDTAIARSLIEGDRSRNITNAHAMFMSLCQPAKRDEYLSRVTISAPAFAS